jgi:hypothetical protein
MSGPSAGQLSRLSRFWMEQYLRRQDRPPFVAIVGAERDAIGSAEAFGTTIVENLAFMTGYLAYPCDAVYVTVCMPVVGVHPDGMALPEVARHQLAVVAWSYSVPTAERHSIMMIRDIDDDGIEHWEQVDPHPEVEAVFAGIEMACRSRGHSELSDLEAVHRRSARDVIERTNGLGYVVTFLGSREILDTARTVADMDKD